MEVLMLLAPTFFDHVKAEMRRADMLNRWAVTCEKGPNALEELKGS